MTFRVFLAILSAQCIVVSINAFSARSVARPFDAATKLKASLTSMSDEEAQYLFARARDCSLDSECSIEESQEHLHDVLNIQVACASGAVAGHDVCDNQQEVAEIVARLRENINTHQHGLTPKQQAVYAGSLLPIAFLALTCASMLLVNANPDVTPITFQEIVWSARDGYLDDLVSHVLRNGGL